MFELDLILQADVLVALVLELFDETTRLFLRFAVCSESPTLYDLEDLEQRLVGRSESELGR